MGKIVDQNMIVPGKVEKEDLVWYDAKQAPFTVYGLCDPAHSFRRLPEDFPILSGFGEECTGGRIRFATDSPYIAIHARLKPDCFPTIMSPCGVSGIDLYRVEADQTETFVNTFRLPTVESAYGEYEGCLSLPKENREYVLYLPVFMPVLDCKIGISGLSSLSKGTPYRMGEKPVVFYGSSITHGAAASRPGNAYDAIICQRLGVNRLNLGFSGNAKGEPVMAEYIARQDMLAFVLDYDHNTPSPEHLKATHFPFYETVRKAHPQVPILMVTAPVPVLTEAFRARRRIIEESYEKAVAAGDRNVAFVDGSRLLDGPLKQSCTVDGCHPNDLGFYRMARGIGNVLAGMLGLPEIL